MDENAMIFDCGSVEDKTNVRAGSAYEKTHVMDNSFFLFIIGLL